MCRKDFNEFVAWARFRGRKVFQILKNSVFIREFDIRVAFWNAKLYAKEFHTCML